MPSLSEQLAIDSRLGLSSQRTPGPSPLDTLGLLLVHPTAPPQSAMLASLVLERSMLNRMLLPSPQGRVLLYQDVICLPPIPLALPVPDLSSIRESVGCSINVSIEIPQESKNSKPTE